MAKKRYLIEFGTGADIHGMNVTKAAKKALRDAISHCCMVGLNEVLALENPAQKLSLDVVIATPFKEKLDVTEALTGLPAYKNIHVSVVDGGLTVEGMYSPELGEGKTICVVNAAITVWIDV